MTNAKQTESSAQQVADAIAAGYRESPVRSAEVLAALLADTIEIVHEPRMPEDGFRDGAAMGAMRMREVMAFQKALRGFQQKASVNVDGDYVSVLLTINGQRANGDSVSETVTSRFRIANGKIVQMIATPNSASFAVLGSVLQEGGFTG